MTEAAEGAGASPGAPAAAEKISGTTPTLAERLQLITDSALRRRLDLARLEFGYAVTPIQRHRMMAEIDALRTEHQRRGIPCA